METLLDIEKPYILYFKSNEQSMNDKSTIKNSETFGGKRKSTGNY